MLALVAALQDPACYPHPADGVELIETHISWVFLAGEYAYKVKKPVRLPFLDFSTLAARRRFCEEELRLNQRTAPGLYLEVVPIVQAAHGFAVAASGDPVEYAVRMRRFADSALADGMAWRGELGAEQIDLLAAALARFHARAPRASPADPFGAPGQIAALAAANFEQIEALGLGPPVRGSLRAWSAAQSARLAPAFAARRAGGWVRECHGDLHLGNIAFIEGAAVPFDCIEFDPALRWIDVMSEVAFLVMDLHAHGLPGSAWRLLNAWLEETGDYAGMGVLRYYLVYRAMVRAKIAGLRGSGDERLRYLGLAESLAAPRNPMLILMHGFSGSGKTTVSQLLLERPGAVRLRSDVERKRLHGLPLQAHRGEAPQAGLYAPGASRRTYAQLENLAAGILDAGYCVIVDAAFLQRAQREPFLRLAGRCRARCVIAACSAAPAALRRRVRERGACARDASDADLAVLEYQLTACEPLTAEEQALAVTIDTDDAPATRRALEGIAAA